MTAAVVGCGTIAPQHIESLKLVGVRIVALCDVDAAKAERLKAAHRLDCPVLTAYDDVLALRPDCVHVCTPHYLHAAMAIGALNAGINVFVEKPLCITPAELADIQVAAARSKAQLGVCFQNRYTAAACEAKRLSGNIRQAYCSVQWQRDAAYYASADWRGKRATEGGGVLINQAIHTLDMLMWFIGEPKYVTATVSNRTHQGIIDVEDTAEGVLEFDGCQAVFYATVSAVGNLPVEVIVAGDRTLRYSGGELLVDGRPVVLPEKPTLKGKEYWGSAHPAIIGDFYDCLSTGRPFPVDATEGGRTVRLLDAMYHSDGKRRQVL